MAFRRSGVRFPSAPPPAPGSIPAHPQPDIDRRPGSARRQKVPEATITAIREKHTRGIPAEDAQIIEFTRELIRKHRVSDESAKALLARFGDEGMIEFTGAIGYYSMLCMMANAVELEAGPGAEVLKV